MLISCNLKYFGILLHALCFLMSLPCLNLFSLASGPIRHRKLGGVDADSGRTLLDIEFEKIQKTIHSEPFKTFGTLPPNRQKNRYHNVIPCKYDMTETRL